MISRENVTFHSHELVFICTALPTFISAHIRDKYQNVHEFRAAKELLQYDSEAESLYYDRRQESKFNTKG